MGITAENVANRFNISREQQDEFAARSHERALAAIEKGAFVDEIVPVHGVKFDSNGERQMFEFKVDEMPRPGTTAEALSKLRPVFAAKGSVTAGNSSPLSDGAAAAIVMKKKRAQEARHRADGDLQVVRHGGRRPVDHGHRPPPRCAEAPRQERPHRRRHRRVRGQRGLRQPGGLRPATSSASPTTSSTSTAAPSP